MHKVLQAYQNKNISNASAQKYIGSDDSYDADYPFSAFFRVYDYFQRYGLYTERKNRIIPGTNGKVSWKTTLNKAHKIISDGNLIFSPIYVQKKAFDSVFITDCMAFVIDYTIERFNSFLGMKPTGCHKVKFDFIGNSNYVVRILKQEKAKAFKDINIKLIQNLMDFYSQIAGNQKGGKTHIRIKYFDKIWQDMVELYLNKHFVSVDKTSNQLLFDPSLSQSKYIFNSTRYSDIDISPNTFNIDVDHISVQGNELYIFDSKYYSDLNELNYKQYSYNEILRYYYPSVSEIYNALILPGIEVKSELHFNLAPKYRGTSRHQGNSIIAQYLLPKELMCEYII